MEIKVLENMEYYPVYMYDESFVDNEEFLFPRKFFEVDELFNDMIEKLNKARQIIKEGKENK